MAVDDIIADLLQLVDPANIERAGLTAYSAHVQRIFEGGESVAGSEIGQYSTRPAYFNPSNSPRSFSARGKNGETRFKNGKPHVTRYFPSGYKGYRRINGRPVNAVNLMLTGDLARSYVPGFVGDRYSYGFINQKFAEIAEGNEEKFRAQVFALSPDEISVFTNTLTDHL